MNNFKRKTFFDMVIDEVNIFEMIEEELKNDIFKPNKVNKSLSFPSKKLVKVLNKYNILMFFNYKQSPDYIFINGLIEDTISIKPFLKDCDVVTFYFDVEFDRLFFINNNLITNSRYVLEDVQDNSFSDFMSFIIHPMIEKNLPRLIVNKTDKGILNLTVLSPMSDKKYFIENLSNDYVSISLICMY